MKNIYLQVLDHKSDFPNLILATVTKVKGSTPQKPGSSALFGKNGLIAGTVGGGVVEGRVSALVKQILVSGNSGIFLFSLNNDIEKKDEAICGGEITILIDAKPENHIKVFEQILASQSQRIPGVLITMITKFNESTVLINRYWMNRNSEPEMPEGFLMSLRSETESMLNAGSTIRYKELELKLPDEEPSSTFLLEAVFPPERLIIAGAGHIGKALAHLGSLLDFDVTVVDDRGEFANKDNIPDANHLIVKDIGAAFEGIEKTRDTYVVIVTRGHNDDAAALKPCIGTPLAYTGMIGSGRKVASMKEEFIKKGWATKSQWDKIYAPVGIDIKSRTIEEIAVSIAAQLVEVRNSKS